MNDERAQFEQLVIACLEAPDDTSLRTQRDALLAVHPDWAADRAEIEALWRAAQLTAPGLDGAPAAADAPELSAKLEAQLIAQHAAPKPRLRPRLLFALAASVAILLTLALRWGPHLTSRDPIAFDRNGHEVSVDSTEAILVRDGDQWQQVGDLPDNLPPRRLAALTALLQPNTSPSATPVTRGPGQRVEFWAPLDDRIGRYSPLRFYSIDGAAVRLELRRRNGTTVIWQTEVPAGPPGPRVVELPDDLHTGWLELLLTPLDNPLQQVRTDLALAGPDESRMLPARPKPSTSLLTARAKDEAGVAALSVQLLFNPVQPADVTIEALLPLAADSPVARQTLRAVATAYELPYLAAYVDELSAVEP